VRRINYKSVRVGECVKKIRQKGGKRPGKRSGRSPSNECKSTNTDGGIGNVTRERDGAIDGVQNGEPRGRGGKIVPSFTNHKEQPRPSQRCIAAPRRGKEVRV